MWKFLEKLRGLPEESRKMVVLFSSACITAILMVSWLVFPVPHFGSLSDAEKERKSAEKLITPFSVIGGEVHQAAGDIKEKWSSFGGTAGILSAVTAVKENFTGGNATSAPQALLGSDVAASSTDEVVNTTSTEREVATTTRATATGETF